MLSSSELSNNERNIMHALTSGISYSAFASLPNDLNTSPTLTFNRAPTADPAVTSAHTAQTDNFEPTASLTIDSAVD